MRLVEAWKIVGAVRDRPEIAAFVHEAGAKEPADWLREHFAPEGGAPDSEVERVFREDRNWAVHGPTVGSPELQGVIAAAQGEAARIVEYPDKRRAVIEFPELALARATFGEPMTKEFTRAVASRADLAQDAFLRFKALLDAALSLQCRKRGVDTIALTQVVGGGWS